MDDRRPAQAGAQNPAYRPAHPLFYHQLFSQADPAGILRSRVLPMLTIARTARAVSLIAIYGGHNSSGRIASFISRSCISPERDMPSNPLYNNSRQSSPHFLRMPSSFSLSASSSL